MSENPKWQVARLDDIERRGRDIPVREHLRIQAFGINAYTPGEDGTLIGEHDESGSGQEELYIVLDGTATFELDGETVDAPAGTFVFVEPGVKRTAFAEEPGTTLVAVGGAPGRAYEPSGWELWAPIRPLYEAGQYDEAADRARELVEANPEYPLLAYNLACVESLAGRKEDALEHLRQAVERSDRVRDFAAGDTDFDPIRDDPRFGELVSAGR
jgi:tetratricopeptide (TPR) repeat protein